MANPAPPDKGETVAPPVAPESEKTGQVERPSEEGGKRNLERSQEAESKEPPRRKRKRRSGWDVGGQPQKTASANAAALAQKAALLAAAKVGLSQAPAAAPRLSSRVYVGSLPYHLTEEHVQAAFAPFGTVLRVDMPREAPGRSKGFCFVEYDSDESASAAIAQMNGFVLAGRSIKVGKPTGSAGSGGGAPFRRPMSVVPGMGAPQMMGMGFPPMMGMMPMMAMQRMIQMNQGVGVQGPLLRGPVPMPLNAAQAFPVATMPPAGKSARVYVGSIPYSLTPEHLMSVFDAFGKIRSCDLIPNPDGGGHKGYGFIEYEEEKAAQEAIKSMDGFEILDRRLKVGPATGGKGGGESMGPGSAAPGNVHASLLAQAQAKIKALKEESLDSQENMTISASERYRVMQRLAHSSKEARCVVLDNMVEPDEVDASLEVEVKQECERHGSVQKVVVAHSRRRNKVRIFVLYEAKASAVKAREALDNRYFGGKVVKAEFYETAKFLNKDYGFP